MGSDLKPLTDYIALLQKSLSAGYASEGSHYPALKTLSESPGDGIIAISLPGR